MVGKRQRTSYQIKGAQKRVDELATRMQEWDRPAYPAGLEEWKLSADELIKAKMNKEQWILYTLRFHLLWLSFCERRGRGKGPCELDFKDYFGKAENMVSIYFDWIFQHYIFVCSERIAIPSWDARRKSRQSLNGQETDRSPSSPSSFSFN